MIVKTRWPWLWPWLSRAFPSPFGLSRPMPPSTAATTCRTGDGHRPPRLLRAPRRVAGTAAPVGRSGRRGAARGAGRSRGPRCSVTPRRRWRRSACGCGLPQRGTPCRCCPGPLRPICPRTAWPLRTGGGGGCGGAMPMPGGHPPGLCSAPSDGGLPRAHGGGGGGWSPVHGPSCGALTWGAHTRGGSAGRLLSGGGGGGWHKASVSDCLPLATPIGLSPPLILTLCGSERVLVVSMEPPDNLSCLTTPGVGRPGDGLWPVPLTRCIQMHTPSPCGGLLTSALTCARWGVHLQDTFPDRGF